MVFAGDTSRLQADGTDAIVNFTRNAEGKVLKIEPGMRVRLSDLRFKREQLQHLLNEQCDHPNGEITPYPTDLPGTVLNLPAGTVHLRFGDLPELIAEAFWPVSSESDELRQVTYFGACQHLERELSNAAKAGTLPVLNPLTFGPHTLLMGAALKRGFFSVDALRSYMAGRLSVVVSVDPKHANELEPHDALAVALPEKTEQRQERRLQACIDAGLPMDTRRALQRLPDGVGAAADRENVSRQTFSVDVKAALRRREIAKRDGK
jgi:hypothetical protein